MFKYDPKFAHADFQKQGYFHFRDIVDEEFLSYLQQVFEDSIAARANEKTDWEISGKKRQYLFDFPSAKSAETFRQGMAAVTGIAPENFTISERHLKVYDPSAKPRPAPHKDRAASEISIGIPVHIPNGSSTCVFPHLEFGPNCEERAVFMSDDEYGDLHGMYDRDECVVLGERPGDILAFLGSSIFHERINAANAAILYLKVNGTGRDPLNENIYTAEMA